MPRSVSHSFNRWRRCDRCSFNYPEKDLIEQRHPVTKVVSLVCTIPPMNCAADVSATKHVPPEEKTNYRREKVREPLLRPVPDDWTPTQFPPRGMSDVNMAKPFDASEISGEFSENPKGGF